jgi:hypothetical protein
MEYKNMKSFFWRLTLKLKRKPYWLQISILFFFSYLIVISVFPFLFLTELADTGNTSGPDITIWVSVIVFAPLFETFLNQYLPYKLMQKWSFTKTKSGLYILLSAFIFGLCHCYNIKYMIFAFSVGLILGYTYLFYSKTPSKAFWSTTLIHAIRNSMVILIACIPDLLK